MHIENEIEDISCPECHSYDVSIDSGSSKGYSWSTSECLECGHCVHDDDFD
jgi:hypothetical protein